MTKPEALKIFGSTRVIARLLGVSDAAVSQWKYQLPKWRNHQLEVLRPGFEKKKDSA
jgi:hypothetical protein